MVVPGPLVLNVDAIRDAAALVAGKKFRATFVAEDVRVTASNDVVVYLYGPDDGRMLRATLREPLGDSTRLGVLRFDFADALADG